jgi:hypothetical protein
MSRKIRCVDIVMIAAVLSLIPYPVSLIPYPCYLQLQWIVLVDDLQERRDEIRI